MPEEEKNIETKVEAEKAPTQVEPKEPEAVQTPKVRVGTPVQTGSRQFDLNNMSVEQMAGMWPEVKKELANLSTVQF